MTRSVILISSPFPTYMSSEEVELESLTNNYEEDNEEENVPTIEESNLVLSNLSIEAQSEIQSILNPHERLVLAETPSRWRGMF